MNSNGCKLCRLVQSTAEKRRTSLEAELEMTKKLLDQQRDQGLKLRKDFMKETTNLREIIQGMQSNDTSMVSKVKTAILVKFFDETDGLDSNVCELLNQRLDLIKREQEAVLAKKDTLIQDMKKRIDVMDKLQSETYALINIPIATVFSGVAAVHPHAYPVFKAFVEAYPRDHFRACMKESLANGQKSGIISKFREVKYKAEVQQCIALCEQKTVETVEYYRKKLEWAEDIKHTSRDNMIREREINEAELNKITQMTNANAKRLIEQEQIRQSVYFETKYAAQIQEKTQIMRDLQRIQETAKQGEQKFAFQKWIMITRFERFMFKTMKIPQERYELYRSQARAEILGHHDALLKLSNCYNLEMGRSEELRKTIQRLEKRIIDLRGDVEGEKQKNSILMSRVETNTSEIQLLQKYADTASKSQMIAELQLRCFKKETEEITDLLKLQNSIRENYEVRFGLGSPKDYFGKEGFAMLAPEQDENELDSLFKMLRSNLVSAQAMLTLNFAKQQLALMGPGSKKKVDTFTQTELTCVGRKITLQEKDEESPSIEVETVECQTDLRGNLIDHTYRSTLQLNKLINEGLLSFSKPPNVDLDIIEGAINGLIDTCLESQGADRIEIDYIGLANAIFEVKNWNKKVKKEKQQVTDADKNQNTTSKKSLPKTKKSNADLNLELQSQAPSQDDILQELQNQMSEAAFSKSSDGKVKLQIQKLDPIVNERQNRERQLAESTFEAYVELLAVIEKLDPNLFRASVKTLKESLTRAIDFSKTSYLMKNFPEKIPDVFARLWETRLEPKTLISRRELVQKTKLELQKSLLQQGLISEPPRNKKLFDVEHMHNVQIKSQSPEPRNNLRVDDQKSVYNSDIPLLDAQITQQDSLRNQNRTKTAGRARNYKKAISTLKRLANEQLESRQTQDQTMQMRQSTFAMRSSQDLASAFKDRDHNTAQRKSVDFNMIKSLGFQTNRDNNITSALSLPSTAKASNVTQSKKFQSSNVSHFPISLDNHRNLFVLSRETNGANQTDFVKTSILSPTEFQYNFPDSEQAMRRKSVQLFHVPNYKTSQLLNL